LNGPSSVVCASFAKPIELQTETGRRPGTISRSAPLK
jgi:hypothetical protein